MGAALLVLVVLGQEPATDSADDRAARLAFMRRSVELYELRPAGRPATPYRLRRDPVLRFTNPVGTLKDGGLFLWVGEADRPAAAVQASWQPERGWTHELTSLSVAPLVAAAREELAWQPSRGISFEPVAGAPRPADRAEARLRQVRELAEGFSATHRYQNRVWNDLRRLSTPLARYGGERSQVRDGALFAFVHGTDPEVLLMLEARQHDDRLRWEYALAPMTSFAVNASWKGQTVWSRSVAWPVMRSPDEAFHVRTIANAGSNGAAPRREPAR
jgi:hypothetical protein